MTWWTKMVMSSVDTVDIECLCTLVVLCGTFAVITSAVSFPGWSHDLWLMFSFVSPCLLCLYSWNFVPRVSSLQSLILGTRSVFCSSPHNLVSITGHKCAPLWIIWTGYEPCAPGTLGLHLRPPSCSCAIFSSCYINFPHSFSLFQPQNSLSSPPIASSMHSCPHGRRLYQFLNPLLPKALLLQLLDLEGGNEGFPVYQRPLDYCQWC